MKQKPILIPKPCHENWDKMTPNEQGRHCKSCAKTVVDGTHLTDAEIWKKHRINNNSLCVRLPSWRVTTLPPTIFYQIKVAIAASIMGFWLTVKQAVYAQTDSTTTKKNKLPVDSNQIIQKIVITGAVFDSIDRFNALTFCKIFIYQNNQVIGQGYSDFEGHFKLSISGNFSSTEKLALKFSLVGYKDAQIALTPKDSIHCDIYMNESHICLNEAVITVRRDSYIVGRLPMTKGIMINFKEGKSRRKILDQYDTKTYYSDEIERLNLGR